MCIFLFGGNDANNMLVPNGHRRLCQLPEVPRRRLPSGGLALTRAACFRSPRKRSRMARPPFGLHPNLPEVQALFNSGKLAFLANVGPLAQPVTRAQYLANSSARARKSFFACRSAAAMAELELDGFYKTGWAGPNGRQHLAAFNSSSPFPADHFGGRLGDFLHRRSRRSPYAIIPGTDSGPFRLR